MSTTTMEHVFVEIPATELTLFRSLARKFGWAYKRHKKSGIEKAMDDVRAGRISEAANIDDLMQQLNA